MSLKIEAGKFYRTRDGQEARIYCTDGGSNTPVHGAIKKFGKWNVNFWSTEGNNQFSPEIDLIVEIKPKTKFFAFDASDSNHGIQILLTSDPNFPGDVRLPQFDQELDI